MCTCERAHIFAYLRNREHVLVFMCVYVCLWGTRSDGVNVHAYKLFVYNMRLYALRAAEYTMREWISSKRNWNRDECDAVSVEASRALPVKTASLTQAIYRSVFVIDQFHVGPNLSLSPGTDVIGPLTIVLGTCVRSGWI